MLTLTGISYMHPNKNLLFNNLSLAINKYTKIALIGNNGTGKSTLLKIMAGELHAASGSVKVDSTPYCVPQHFGQFNALTIAEALGVKAPMNALKEILEGNVSEKNLEVLNDDWHLEERCREALNHWHLKDIDLTQKLSTLSGGQKTRVFLAGILIHQPEIILMDEPSNNLDLLSRKVLYDYIKTTPKTLVIVSHDRALLNLLSSTYELSENGIKAYGGNYEFYKQQKERERTALENGIREKEKAARKAKDVEKESLERKQKLDSRGRKKQESAGLPKILLNTFKNNAEKSMSRMKDAHSEKINSIRKELDLLRKDLAGTDQIKIDLDNSTLHNGKTLISAEGLNFSYGEKTLWKKELRIKILNGERVAIKGKNGSGKTTLLKLISGNLEPTLGKIESTTGNSIYLDQEYSLIKGELSVYEQAQQANSGGLREHEIKTRLNRFLFTKEDWDKPCNILSGGEKMRLTLCLLAITFKAPDIIALDEPTNNLDLRNVEILKQSVNAYKGTLLVISHDEDFLEQINIQHSITLD